MFIVMLRPHVEYINRDETKGNWQKWIELYAAVRGGTSEKTDHKEIFFSG